MQNSPATHPRTLIAAALAAALATCAGCGGSSAASDDTESATWSGDGSERVLSNAADPTVLTPGAKGLPVVYVLHLDGQRGQYSYRIQGEEYLERDFLGLCRTILRDNPALTVSIHPAASLSDDETGLVAARIREIGVQTVKILDSNGRERL